MDQKNVDVRLVSGVLVLGMLIGGLVGVLVVAPYLRPQELQFQGNATELRLQALEESTGQLDERVGRAWIEIEGGWRYDRIWSEEFYRLRNRVDDLALEVEVLKLLLNSTRTP